MDYGMAIGHPLAPPPDPFARQDAGDELLMAQFYMGVVPDDAATAEQGRPIYRDVECVRISVPGDRNNVVDHPVEPRDRQRFHKQYAAFKAGMSEEQQLVGTPLTDWSVVTRAQVEELKYLGIRTVDQVAVVNDNVCSRVPGLTGLKQKAQIWLDKSKTAAEATRLDKLISGLQNDNESLRKALADQAAVLERMQAKA